MESVFVPSFAKALFKHSILCVSGTLKIKIRIIIMPFILLVYFLM